MPKRKLEMINESSWKFWTISLEDDTLTVVFGRGGTMGRTIKKSFESVAKAKSAYEKLIQQKIDNGYADDDSAIEEWKPIKQTALPQKELSFLRKIYTSEINSRTLRRELEPIDDPVLLHYVAWLSAETLTWHDVGFDWPKSVLLHPKCDAGTALMIYWLGDPAYAYSVEPDNWQHPNQRDLKKIETAYIGEQYNSQKIAFDPTPHLPKPKDRHLISKVPYGMTISSKGRTLKPLQIVNKQGQIMF